MTRGDLKGDLRGLREVKGPKGAQEEISRGQGCS